MASHKITCLVVLANKAPKTRAESTTRGVQSRVQVSSFKVQVQAPALQGKFKFEICKPHFFVTAAIFGVIIMQIIGHNKQWNFQHVLFNRNITICIKFRFLLKLYMLKTLYMCYFLRYFPSSFPSEGLEGTIESKEEIVICWSFWQTRKNAYESEAYDKLELSS